MKKIKKIVIAASAIALTAIIAMSVVIYGYSSQNRTVYETLDNGETENDARSENILFLGTDAQAGLTDVIMLINIDRAQGRMTVMQIPRDTYAAYTDASYKKLNGAYISLGGAKQTAEFIGDVMGIDIHHYMCISLETLGKAVDAVGGVEIDLPVDMTYSDPEQGLYIDLKAGKQTLDGNTAQHFVRFRAEYVNGDLGRIDAQKLFMAAFFKRVSENFSPIIAAKLTAAVDGVETDLSAADMFMIGSRAIGLGSGNIFFVTLPGEEATATESGASYYVISANSASELTGIYFGRTSDFDRNGKLLNNRYESFRRIYGEYREYSPVSVADMLGG